MKKRKINNNRKKAGRQMNWGIKTAYNYTKKLKKRKIHPELIERIYYDAMLRIKKELLNNLCSKIKDNGIYNRRDYLDLLIEIVLQKINQETKKELNKNFLRKV